MVWNMCNPYGGQSVVYTDENGERRGGFIHDRMPGKHGFIGILFLDNTFDFVEDAQVEYL